MLLRLSGLTLKKEEENGEGGIRRVGEGFFAVSLYVVLMRFSVSDLRVLSLQNCDEIMHQSHFLDLT